MTKGKGLILVIVESPGKVAKIQHILGDDYLVMASVGHIMDLDKSNFSIDVDNNFALSYKIMEGKEQIVKKIKSAYYDCLDLLIATDEDREGEMIAWSIAQQLKVKKPKRITFNSITKTELLNAVKKPTEIDYNLVDAQKLRRVLDRMIGYKISPLLWKSMGSGQLSAGRVQSVVVKLIIEKENEIKKFLTQNSVSYFRTNGEFVNGKNNVFKAQLYTTKKQEKYDDDENIKLSNDEESDEEENIKKSKKSKKSKKNIEEEDVEQHMNKKGEIAKIPSEEETMKIMKEISKSVFEIVDTQKREKISQPSAPFTTSTLQQEASRKFGFGSKRTMQAAQHLYEAGHITYMRTDSTNLSEEALKLVEEFIIDKYGKPYHREKIYSSKKQNTQEAHEAVRPTDPKILGVSANSKYKIGSDEIKLYTLIWKRTIASQMSPAKFDVYSTEISISKLNEYYFVNQIENNTFAGFLIVYNLANDKNEVDENEDTNKIEDQTENIDIPKNGTKLTAKKIISLQDYKKPPTRYNEASLINKLDPKNLNIGRPGTYAPTIDKIQSAGYVRKEDIEGEEKTLKILSWNGNKKSEIDEKESKIFLGKEKNKFVPTDVGMLVNNFLEKYFDKIIDYQFTADMEKELDSIAIGKKSWTDIAGKFWNEFLPLVEGLDKKIKPKEMADSNARELGVHPENGNKLIATIAKYGPIIKMIDKENPNSVSYGPIKKPLTLEKITLADAVKIMKYPKNIGKYKNKIVKLHKGPYGYYVKVGDEKFGLKNTDDDIDDLEMEDVIKAIEGKSLGQLWKGTDNKNNYVVKDGEFGKYINVKPIVMPKTSKNKYGTNVKLPENTDLETLTTEKVIEIINNHFERKKQSTLKKNKTPTKTKSDKPNQNSPTLSNESGKTKTVTKEKKQTKNKKN